MDPNALRQEEGKAPERNGDTSRSRRPIPLFPLAASLLSAALFILAGGLFLVRNEKRKATEEWRVRLTAMADDREVAIEGWIHERLGDVQMAASEPAVLTLLRDSRNPANPARAEASEHLQGILDAMAAHYGYVGVYVLGKDGGILARQRESQGLPPSVVPDLVSRARTARAPWVTLARDESGMPLLLFAGRAPPDASEPGDAPVGTVVLMADPSRWLYPLLTREPVPTRTQETTLAHRTGKGYEFVSPLRKVTGQPLSLTIPPDRPNLAAERALSGVETFGQFQDYAGAKVLAATRHIRGTDWGLVVKVDRDEAMGEYRREALWTTVLLAMFLLAAAAISYNAWRRQRYLYFREIALGRERYRILDEQARDMMIFTRPDGRIVDVNRIAEKAYGYTRQELLKMRVTDLRVERERPLFARQVQRAVEEGVPLETVHARKDGTTFPIEAAVQQVKLGDEDLLFAVVRDVTERKKAEEALRDSESRFRRVVEAAPVAMSWHDGGARVRFINRKGTERFGYTLEDIPTTQRWFELAYPDPAYRNEVLERWTDLVTRAAREGSEIEPLEVNVTCKDGTVRPVEIMGTMVGENTFVVLNDLTERKRLEEEIQRTRTDKAVSLLSQAMAHEIRNPLFALQLNAAALEKQCGALAENAAYFANIHEQVNRLDVLTREMLDLTIRPLERDFVECTAAELLQTARARVDERAPGGSGRIDLELGGRPCRLRAIPEKLVQVFLNLFLNALQHSPPEGRVLVRAEALGRKCLVTVKDEGEGITESMADRLFEPFSTSRPGQKGTGLALVRHHVASHGGSVTGVNNDPPPGATFTVSLPLLPSRY